jgi:hypothetical protein
LSGESNIYIKKKKKKKEKKGGQHRVLSTRTCGMVPRTKIKQTELSGLGFLNVENRVKQLRLKQHLP